MPSRYKHCTLWMHAYEHYVIFSMIAGSDHCPCLSAASSMLLVQVPDVDFLLHLGDGSPQGLPLVQVNINRAYARAGFTLPMLAWKEALGLQQFAVLAECLQVGSSGMRMHIHALSTSTPMILLNFTFGCRFGTPHCLLRCACRVLFGVAATQTPKFCGWMRTTCLMLYEHGCTCLGDGFQKPLMHTLLATLSRSLQQT